MLFTSRGHRGHFGHFRMQSRRCSIPSLNDLFDGHKLTVFYISLPRVEYPLMALASTKRLRSTVGSQTGLD